VCVRDPTRAQCGLWRRIRCNAHLPDLREPTKQAATAVGISEVRVWNDSAYNQEMLERTQVRSHVLFYCVEDSPKAWRYHDWTSGRSGVFSQEQLVSLMERIA
jgi:hypothetical protein